MNKYKVSFTGELSIDWTSEYKPSRMDIKDSIIKAILNMPNDELAEYLKISTVEEIVD